MCDFYAQVVLQQAVAVFTIGEQTIIKICHQKIVTYKQSSVSETERVQGTSEVYITVRVAANSEYDVADSIRHLPLNICCKVGGRSVQEDPETSEEKTI